MRFSATYYLVVQAEPHTRREIDLITLPAGQREGVGLAEAAFPRVISRLHLVFGRHGVDMARREPLLERIRCQTKGHHHARCHGPRASAREKTSTPLVLVPMAVLCVFKYLNPVFRLGLIL